MKKIVLFASLVSFVPILALAQNRVFVYTTTDPNGFVDDTSRGRTDAVKDIIEKLKNKKQIKVVDDKGKADLTLEVLSRDYESTGSATTLRNPVIGSTTTVNKRATIHVKLTSLNTPYTTEIVGGAPSTYLNAWSNASGDVASKVEKFVKENKDRLTEK